MIVLAAAAGVLVASAVIVLWLRRRYIVITVTGVSMEPAYRSGDRVLVRRAPLASVRRGQAVLLAGTLAEMWPEMAAPSPDGAARPPSRRSPRTSAVPAAVPAAVREPAEEPFRMVKRATAVPGDPIPRDVPSLRHVPGRVVPEGLLVVLGDNAEASRDSRHFGYAPSEWLVGVVVRRIAAG